MSKLRSIFNTKVPVEKANADNIKFRLRDLFIPRGVQETKDHKVSGFMGKIFITRYPENSNPEAPDIDIN